MRGTVQPISRLPAARLIMAGAALLAGACISTTAAAQHAPAGDPVGTDDETAYAAPRGAPYGGAGVTLPRPLAPSQAVLVRRIFTQQAVGKLAEATRDTALLDDTLLLGQIQAYRYLGRFHRSTLDELNTWLSRYEDHPDAAAIHALLLRRAPKGSVAPRPQGAAGMAPVLAHVPRPIAPPEEIDETMRALPADGAGAPALTAFARAEQARELFTQNRDAEALEMAGAAFRRGPASGKVGFAGYVAGLAAWRLDRTDLARHFFEDAAKAPMASPALRAAASFWAARANVRAGHPGASAPWLRRAASEKRTFYGLLARRTLGRDAGLNWQRESLTEADIEAVDAIPGGRRAFALLQVGETQRAEAELRQLWADGQARPGFGRALLLVAREADMIDFAAQLAMLLQTANGGAHDDVRFALPRLVPRGGFRVDPALVYALTRLESNFDAGAVSPAGARGLMQLMPTTAGVVSREDGFSDDRLHDPAINLDLGQRYLVYLSDQANIGNNLIRLLASYNSGPGAFARWGATMRDNDDPLLFIEAIPKAETRQFVQRALTYSWIYAARMQKPAPGLTELAAGAYPNFNAHGTVARASASLH